MDQKIKKSSSVIFIISVCLYLPFIESWFGGTLWGLHWQSPMFMDQLSNYLRVIKLILVLLGGLVLYRKIGEIREKIVNVFARNFFIYSSYLLLTVQVPLLLLGVIFEGISSSNLDYIHKDKTFNDRSIYVYTADPGAMGKAYHYFYLKCQQPFNRYELKLIKKTSWMYEFGFEVQENNLVVTDKSENGKTHIFDITNFTCNAKT